MSARAPVCEWHPFKGRALRGDEESPCKPATVSVGCDGRWHLCEDCAKLSEFDRFRVRKQMKEASK